MNKKILLVLTLSIGLLCTGCSKKTYHIKVEEKYSKYDYSIGLGEEIDFDITASYSNAYKKLSEQNIEVSADKEIIFTDKNNYPSLSFEINPFKKTFSVQCCSSFTSPIVITQLNYQIDNIFYSLAMDISLSFNEKYAEQIVLAEPSYNYTIAGTAFDDITYPPIVGFQHNGSSETKINSIILNSITSGSDFITLGKIEVGEIDYGLSEFTYNDADFAEISFPYSVETKKGTTFFQVEIYSSMNSVLTYGGDLDIHLTVDGDEQISKVHYII